MKSKLRVIVVSESEFSVQGHGVHTAYVETVAALEKQSTVTVTTNNFGRADIRHIHTVGPYALFQLLFGSGRKIVSAHVVPESFVGSLVGAKYWLWLARGYLRWFYNCADVVIAVSDQTKSQLRQLGVGTRIEVVYNMVDVVKYASLRGKKLALRRQLGVDKDKPVVIGNGQIQPRKRFDTFVNTAKQLPELEFIWVGGIPFGKVAAEHVEMQRLCDEAPDNLTVTGVVSLEQVAEYFAVGDVFLMTSEQETFGLAIVEAAAAGLPIVLRDIADYDATFRPHAVMCDESEFAGSIARLLDDKEEYQHYQRQAKVIADKYSSANIVERLIELYASTQK